MPKTLLLADDSVVIQKLVGLSFANEDVELVTTDNGDDAVAKAREVIPDVILADVVMPGMSGYEVCEAIKSDPALAGTPVLLLTGTFEAFDENRAQQVGSDGHITKPFEAQALVDRVNELLAQGRSKTTATPAADDGFDIFDEGASMAESPGTDVTRSAAPTSSRAPAAPASMPGGDPIAPPLAAPMAPAAEAEFDLGGDAPMLPPLDDADLLGDSFSDSLDIGSGPEVGDHTIAFTPETSAPSPAPSPAPQPPVHAGFGPGDAQLDPIDDLMDSGSGDVLVPPPPATSDSAWPAPPAVSPGGGDVMPPALPMDDPLAGPGESDPSLTTIIMSDGDTSSDGLQIGGDPAPVRSLDEDSRVAPAASLELPPAPVMPPAPEVSDPSQTILANDLFGDTPEPPAMPSPSAGPPPADDVFDFGSTDPLASSSESLMDSPPPAAAGEEPPAAPPLASDYDVSSSDLGSSYSALAATEDPLADSAPSIPDTPLEMSESDELSLSDGLLGEPIPMVHDEVEETPEADPMGVSGPLAAAAHAAGPDITPVMRDRIHETLERVAWEAFADLSETMVKQVLERVESIAWEVIPQMAEALVKEEIRRMKGDGEDG
jgi:CheY-like chemotaxis protein